MRTRSRGERETGERCEHERVRQIEIQKERERDRLGAGRVGVGSGGASAYRGSLWSSKQQQQQ